MQNYGQNSKSKEGMGAMDVPSNIFLYASGSK